MRLVKSIPICLVASLVIHFSPPLCAEDRGPFAAFSFSPGGTGYLFVPGPAENGKEDSTKPESGYGFNSAQRIGLSAGYYYDFLQADVSYARTRITNQLSDFSSEEGLKSGTASSIAVRCGYRFAIPGDTSYDWLYLGLKRFDLASSGVDATAYGFLAGYSNFYSFGLSSDFEFVLALDLYLGTYRLDRLSTSNDYTDVSKRYSVSAGGGLGLGVQYEPYNVAALLRVSADYDRIAYKATYAGSKRNLSIGAGSACIGIEIRWCMPSERYNAITR